MMTGEELRKSLKPITDGLFGKQRIRRYERPHFEVRPLGMMLEDLASIQPAEWFRYVFSREPLNGRFDDGQRRSWMEQALACGTEYASKICGQFNTRDPGRVAQGLGMKVSCPEFPERADRVLFAEYRAPDTIRIYMDGVNKAKRFLARPEVAAVLGEDLDIGRLLLAHELFHCVEERYRDQIFTKTEKIRLWSLGPIHNDSRIIALSEIAAMAFAREMTGIGYAPYLMDVFLVYGYSPEEACGLYEEMMESAGREPRSGETGGEIH